MAKVRSDGVVVYKTLEDYFESDTFLDELSVMRHLLPRSLSLHTAVGAAI